MKVWELEEGKIYRNTKNYYKYKIKEGKLFCWCDNCLWIQTHETYNSVINMNFEEIKREIDWSKVPQGTKVQVQDFGNKEWLNRYFVECVNGHFMVSILKEDDDFTGKKVSYYAYEWEDCRIHESVEIPDSWYKEA